jgi:hypothetical protein
MKTKQVRPYAVVLLALTSAACTATTHDVRSVGDPGAGLDGQEARDPGDELDVQAAGDPEAGAQASDPDAGADAQGASDPDAGSDARAPESGAGGGPDASPPVHVALPAHPSEFRVELSGGPCYGSCPTYQVSVDQDGAVRFVGEQCVARPGVFTHQISQADARAIYDAIIASPYPTLGDSYVTESDGCKVWTDSSTTRWRVLGDGQEKTLERYNGCEGVAKLSEVDALERVVQTQSAVLSWLSPSPFNCDYQVAKLASEAFYRLDRLGVPAALLRIESSNGWRGSFSLRDCAGVEVARGSVGPEHGRLVLIEAERGPIVLPGGLGSVGSLVMEGESAGFNEPSTARRVRGLLAETEIEFGVMKTASCNSPLPSP